MFLSFRTPLVFYISGGMFQYAISAVPFVGSCGRRIGAPLPWKLVRHRVFFDDLFLGRGMHGKEQSGEPTTYQTVAA